MAPELPAPMRQPLRPNRSPLRVTTTASGWSRATSTAVVMSSTQTATPSSPSSNSATPGLDDLTCGRTASTEPRVRRRCERPRTERDDRSARRRIAQRIEGAAPGRRIVHDDRGERFTERGLDGRSPSSSISTRSSSVPSTPSMPTSRSAPARARAASSASWSASIRAAAVEPRRRHRPPSANAGSR